ncbi:hypothetical protein QT990_16600 [Microcoleus sp. T3_B1]|uniref:hypothetical protein n=1 Tax=Microcoleus sp. T3_B1 TaxID=3055425 RepID=UPI002FCF000D
MTILPKRFFSMDFGDILQIFDDFDDCLTPIALSSWQGSGLSLLSPPLRASAGDREFIGMLLGNRQ